MLSVYSTSIFVNTNNTVDAADQTKNRILMCLEGSIDPTKIIFGGLNSSFSLFVTITGDIDVDNGRVDIKCNNSVKRIMVSLSILLIICTVP
jgi:hypothetical protein